jgi:hypothetical protein
MACLRQAAHPSVPTFFVSRRVALVARPPVSAVTYDHPQGDSKAKDGGLTLSATAISNRLRAAIQALQSRPRRWRDDGGGTRSYETSFNTMFAAASDGRPPGYQ